MRPVAQKYDISLGYLEAYPDYLQYLTEDGRHHGVDYLTPRGTPVKCSADGILNYAGWLRGYGNVVIIKFSVGIFWGQRLYRIILAHLDSISIKKKIGERISKHEEAGLSGASGAIYYDPKLKKTRPFFHLHAEVQQFIDKKWVTINPTFLIGAT